MKVKDVIADPKFKEFLQYRIEFRESRPDLQEKDAKWRREPFDALRDKGLFTVDGILAEFDKVDKGTSTLSRSQREAVTLLVIETTKSVFEFRRQEAEKKEARKLKNRIKRLVSKLQESIKKLAKSLKNGRNK